MADVRVEFFGMARTRAGADVVDVRAATLADVVRELARRYPSLEGSCFQDGELGNSWLFNLNGELFTRDNAMALADGDSILLMSADAGG